MEETAIQAAADKVGITDKPALTGPRIDLDTPPLRRKSLLYRTLSPLASLRLTVALLALSIILVLFGTLAQIDDGIHAVLAGYFRCLVAWVPFQLFVRFGQIFLNVAPDARVAGSFPFPGGWTLGFLLLINLLAAHAVRFKVSWKRSGILILHAGVIMLLLGELVTGLFSVENRMTIWANGSSNFVESHDNIELAVIDASDPKTDDVVAIPPKLLRVGETVKNGLLPFNVEVVRYMVNSSEPQAVRPGDANPATAGDGKLFHVDELRLTSGTDQERADFPSAYVKLTDKTTGKDLGTYLVSLWFTYPMLPHRPQRVTVNGKEYQLDLRYERSYRPFTVQLKEFRHDLYEGTTIPKNYSSQVRLVDPERNEDREVKIYMNNPLRYAGETFYQSGFLPGDRGTILQVVRNPGADMPYIACTMVSLGMLIHFGIGLAGFMERKRGQLTAALKPVGTRFAWSFAGLFPWLVVGIAVLVLVMGALPSHAPRDGLDIDGVAQLPVLQGGRVKPLDSLARDSLIVISGKQTYYDEKGQEQPAIRWLLDVLPPGHAGLDHKVFRIENDEVLALLGLERRPGLRYAAAEFIDKIDDLRREANRAKQIDQKKRNTYEAKLLELAEHLELYAQLSKMEDYQMLPPLAPGGKWQNLLMAFAEMKATGRQDNAPALDLGGVLIAYARHNPDEFNRSLDGYRQYLAKQAPVDTSRSNFEYWLNSFQPFYWCMILYVGVFLLSCGSWLGWRQPLSRAAFWLAVLTLFVHGFALISRMYLMDRWLVFVTNLYSSAVFIGYVSLIMALVLEVIFPLGIATAVAGVVGFLTTLLAHYLARGGDTLGMLQAVLDTNFWLATHVTCVTMGYAATFIAGFLGIGYIVASFVLRGRPGLGEYFKALSLMLYGVICFATLLSFTGTVLGGIWADQSWGRFWGWDTKENGALIIVAWNALILHARWGGIVKQLGMAILAVGGNIVTGWSWFGTNQLGVGLHSYGFNNTLAFGLMIFWAVNFALIGLGAWLASQKRPLTG